MLASGSLWVFCTGCLSCCQQLTQTHTSTHRCRVLQQSVSISFHLYTFLFALATCFHTSHAVFLISFPTLFSLSLPPYLSHSHSPSANLLIYIFFYYWLHLLCAVVSASSSFCVVFVYASFWFSQLKLYLLFLFSLVIPYGQQEQEQQEEQHQLDLSPYSTESALVYPFLRLFLCSAFSSGSVCFVSWVRRRLQVYLCFGLYSAQSAPPTFTLSPLPKSVSFAHV